MSPADRSRLPSPGADPSFHFPIIEKHRLANGLHVWSIGHHALPIAALLLVIPSGSAADPPDAAGLASLTGDMLDEGSGSRSAIDMHEALEQIGAQLETDVTADVTLIGLTTLSHHLERGMILLGDMVVRPRLGAPDVERVRELRLNRLTQIRDLPPAVADRTFLQLVYGDHPYGHPALGLEPGLRRIDEERVAAFHRATYVPSRGTLIAVGDVRAGALVRAAETSFGDWREPEPAEDRSISVDAGLAAPPPATGVRCAIVDRPGAAQSELRIGHVGVARDTPDYHALLVLNMILGGQFVSRINLNLRENKGFTYGARTSFEFRRGRGPFLLQVGVQTKVTAAAVRESLEELEAIREGRPATPAELDLARAALTRGYPRNFETPGQIARAASQLALYGLPDDYFEQFMPQVSRVDTAAVTRVARMHLNPANMLTLIVGDRQAIGSSLSASGFGEPAAVAAV